MTDNWEKQKPSEHSQSPTKNLGIVAVVAVEKVAKAMVVAHVVVKNGIQHKIKILLASKNKNIALATNSTTSKLTTLLTEFCISINIPDSLICDMAIKHTGSQS